MTPADLGGARGGGGGDVWEGKEYGVPTRITLTAIGVEGVLAMCNEYECSWTLLYRDWHKVEPSTKRGDGG